MSNHIHTQSVPRGALFGAAFLILGSIGLAAHARAARLAEHVVTPPPVASLVVRFEDRSDGSLAVIDAKTGRDVVDLAPGQDNFVRGVMRGMFRSRKLESLGHDGEFVIARQANGSLTLEDPQTSRRIELESFGPTNVASFAKILAAGTAGSSTTPS